MGMILLVCPDVRVRVKSEERMGGTRRRKMSMWGYYRLLTAI